MSHVYFSGGDGGQIIASIDLVGAYVAGTGGAVYPRLLISAKMHINTLVGQKCDYIFRELSIQLSLSTLGKIADALPVTLARVQRNHWQHQVDEHVVMEFPLEARRIAKIEEVRNGGDVEFTLMANLFADQYGIIRGDEGLKRPNYWGLCYPQRLSAQGSIKIPKTVWIEQVLPNIGYGVVHVLELPAAPLAECETLGHAFKALHQAQERHRIGLYDDAVGRCRVALEEFFEQELRTENGKTRSIPTLKSPSENSKPPFLRKCSGKQHKSTFRH